MKKPRLCYCPKGTTCYPNDECTNKSTTLREEFYKDEIKNRFTLNEVVDWWLEKLRQAIAEERLKTLKELILEFQSNELDGKGYDFYFAIRTKIDENLSHLTQK